MKKLLTLAFSLLFSAFASNAQSPTKQISYFQNLPSKFFFFEDTEIAVYYDPVRSNVYISFDEGKSWDRPKDLPEGEINIVVPHPFDSRYAFALTKGNKHYRTEDRGRSWRSFKTPLEPAAVSKPLSFHSDPKKFGYILYQGTVCDLRGWGAVCRDETYYTTEAFSDTPKLLLSETRSCSFAHSSKDFKPSAPSDLIFCVAFTAANSHSLAASHLFSSTDFFNNDRKVEDLGIGARNAKGIVAFAIVSKFAVVAMKDTTPANHGEMLLFVSVDALTWAKAKFPHASSAKLRENGYTIVESSTHSLGVDVVLQDAPIGTFFVSNSNGTFFVESLKDTNRNEAGFVDFESIFGIEGVGLANVVLNAEEVRARHARKQLQTRITFDDGSSWRSIRPPRTGPDGKKTECDGENEERCSVHLHSVTTPHNFGRIFSSPAPGLVMGVGSIGPSLAMYSDSDTMLSTDAGLSWRVVQSGAHKYEFGDSGSVLVLVDDEEPTDRVKYSLDLGKTWKEFELGVKMRAKLLTTVQDSTSQKFLLLGQVARDAAGKNGERYAMVFLDFATLNRRKCGESDFEKWYARSGSAGGGTRGCLMGHKQWYKRRKEGVDCFVGEKFHEEVEHEEDCECIEEDYECDYNFIKSGDKCVPVGPEPIPAGICTGQKDQTYMGSSGYRKIPGNTCKGGKRLDDKVEKKCSQAQPAEGQVTHMTFEFPHSVLQHAYFKESTTILVLLRDHSLYQSSNEGYTFHTLFPNEKFLAFYHHPYSHDRAYLITDSRKFYYTTDTGRSWNALEAPSHPNTFRVSVMAFHPTMSDYLIWTGDVGCERAEESGCHAQSHYSRDNGRKWHPVESYVRTCAWARDAQLKVDPAQIICESYRDKRGNQRFFGGGGNERNPLRLVGGMEFFRKKTVLFESVVGFTKFSEFLIVAEYLPEKRSLDLQVSLDGRTFAEGKFPPGIDPRTHSYTVLESSTDSVFLHMTMSESPAPFYGSILKSNSNGTYYNLAIEYVNRDERGYVDFEKMIGLDGIALINVVANAKQAAIHGQKLLQSRITHNDGSTWKALVAPKVDSGGRPFECDNTKCALHVHGYTERTDPRATYSSPSVVGLIMAVGNVGEHLAAYDQSDTFLSRDGGFTWEEVHKDAHLWEFGDSGSILVMANDEEPTDHVLFSTDEGLNWREYKFASSDQKIRVRSIVTVPEDNSRRFILLGNYPRSTHSVAVHIDFSALTMKMCELDLVNPGHDDFELWSPSEERTELCLFGRQTLYHRRVRDRNCVVGKQPKAAEKVVKNCPCSKVDFECEFNHVKNENDECVLVSGTSRLPDDDSCQNGEDYWYERTAYRKIPFSSCEEGLTLHHGTRHVCPGFKAHGFFFWLFVISIPFGITALVGMWYYKKSGLARGTIRLPGEANARTNFSSDSGVMGTLASVPWFLVGMASIAFEFVSSRFDSASASLRTRRGYRDIPVDEDAQVLRFEDED